MIEWCNITGYSLSCQRLHKAGAKNVKIFGFRKNRDHYLQIIDLLRVSWILRVKNKFMLRMASGLYSN